MEIKLQEVLRRELENRNLSKVSAQVGIPTSTLSNWLHGVSVPSGKQLHHIFALAEYLGLSVKELLFNTRGEDESSKILFSSQFTDGSKTYKIIVERKNE